MQLFLPTVSTTMARSISWSGYTWDVRPAGFGAPGPNQWSDSEDNVHVDGSDLVLSVVKDASDRWTSAEVDNQQHLGYGTYRWVVASDLSGLDSHEVLGMFTYGGPSPSNNEIDFEPSHWGRLAWPGGSATVWQDAAGNQSISKTFDYTNRPPYVHEFTWTPGAIHYVVTDGAGKPLLDWTTTSGVPVPSTEVPVVNYWRYENSPPAGQRSMRIASFSWAPPAQDDRAGQDVARLAMSPTQFPVTGKRPGTTLRWTTSRKAKLQLVVHREVGKRTVRVGTLERTVRKGKGRMRFTGRVGKRRLRPGSYRLTATLRAGGGRMRCAPGTLRFAIVSR